MDVSSVCVGWSLWDHGELERHGRQRLKGVGHGQRLVHFQEALRELLEIQRPEEVVYERPFSARRANAYGVLMQYCAIVHLEYWRYATREIPDDNRVTARVVKRVTRVRRGRTHAENKERMVQWANQRFGLNLRYRKNDTRKVQSQDDEADAIAVGFTWLHLDRVREN